VGQTKLYRLPRHNYSRSTYQSLGLGWKRHTERTIIMRALSFSSQHQSPARDKRTARALLALKTQMATGHLGAAVAWRWWLSCMHTQE